MFRLVSNRVAELIPFDAAALFLTDVGKTKLKVAQAVGENAHAFLEVEMSFHEGLAGKTFLSGQIQMDEKLTLEKSALPLTVLQNLKSAIAVPLRRGEQEIFGVLAFYGGNLKVFNAQTTPLLAAIAARISPLFLNSLTFERNLENALTDKLTNLPNERAFYLVLENQIAESQRSREQRPLTVLCLDIKNFDEINKKFGYAIGDRILAFTAKIIKTQLRGMDFLARSVGDEFLAVLPTASEEFTQVIVERIEKAFSLNAFETAESGKVLIALNLGTASFIKDGETGQELLKRAIFKKRWSKSAANDSVLWFPGNM